MTSFGESGGEFALAPPRSPHRRARDEEQPHRSEAIAPATFVCVDGPAAPNDPLSSVPRLTGILCTHRRPAAVLEYLDRLREQVRAPDVVVVVDNGGDEQLRSALARPKPGWPAIRYLDPGVNIGPAGALHVGLREAADGTDSLVVILDDDDPPVHPAQLDSLCAELIAAARDDPRVAGIGLSGGRLRTRSGTIAPVSGTDRVEAVDHLHGGYLPVYRVSALIDVGGADPTFFYGFEELELGRRLHDRGWRLLALSGLMAELQVHYPKRSPRSRRGGTIEEADLDWSRFHKERNLIRILRREGRWCAIVVTVLGRHLAKPLLRFHRQPRAAVGRVRLGLRATAKGLANSGGIDPAYPPPPRACGARSEGTEPTWLVRPRRPTMATYARLCRSSASLMRDLMNLEIEEMDLQGRVLDVGGGRAASYGNSLPATCDLTSINIDPAIRPSVIADVERPLPFRDAMFDRAICFNTLEHVADDQFALNELVRVLKPGGSAHILVPFLYRVHGHPRDFHRHTAHGWNIMLRRAGIPDDLQQIRPLVWDPFATAWAIADLAPLGRNWWRTRRFLRPLVLGRPLLQHPVDARLRAGSAAIQAEYALAYAVAATKPREPCFAAPSASFPGAEGESSE